MDDALRITRSAYFHIFYDLTGRAEQQKASKSMNQSLESA